MYTIAIIAQKGGVGKTTIALNLGVAAHQNGDAAVIIDLDPQASVMGWSDQRENEMPIVISAQASRLKENLKTADSHGADLAIIDTAPHASQDALIAAREADLVLIPTRCGTLDLRALANMTDTIGLAKVDGVVVLNSAPTAGSLPDEVVKAIESSFGLEVCPVRLSQRVAFSHAITESLGVLEYEPDGKAAAEVKELYKWVCRRVDMSTRQPLQVIA